MSLLLFYNFWIENDDEDEKQIKSVLKWTYGKHESTLTLIHTEYIQVICKLNLQTTSSLFDQSYEKDESGLNFLKKY